MALCIEVVRPALEAMGGKIVAAGYLFGEYGFVLLAEAPGDTIATGIELAVATGGGFSQGKFTRLLSCQEWIESLREARGLGGAPSQARRCRAGWRGRRRGGGVSGELPVLHRLRCIEYFRPDFLGYVLSHITACDDDGFPQRKVLRAPDSFMSRIFKLIFDAPYQFVELL